MLLVSTARLQGSDLLTDEIDTESFIGVDGESMDQSDILEIMSELLSDDVEITDEKTADQTLPLEETFERCELVGFEFKKGVECGEVFEVECGPTNITKYRYELVPRCRTRVETKCKIDKVEVPKEHCVTRLKNM